MSEERPIRVVIIDDHQIFRAGLRLILREQAGIEVVGEAGTPEEALNTVEREQPDIIVLDLDLGGGRSGLDLLPQLLDRARIARVLVLTGIADAHEHMRAARRGACGLVLKEQAPATLARAISKVHAGEVWFDHSLLRNMLREREEEGEENASEAGRIAELTAREREVIRLIGEGLRNQEIAERLYISTGTVKTHLRSIFEKLGVHDRFELVIYAYRHDLAERPK